MHYPATFIPHEGSAVLDVCFADLPGCVTQGKDFDDALRMAAEALSLHLGGMLADGDPIPEPSTLEQARARDEAWAREDGAPLPEGTFWHHVYFEPLNPRQVRKEPIRLSVSLRPAAIEQLDAIAAELGLTRSGAIAVAARDYAERLRAGHAR